MLAGPVGGRDAAREARGASPDRDQYRPGDHSQLPEQVCVVSIVLIVFWRFDKG